MCEYDDGRILRYVLENGIINRAAIVKEMMMEDRDRYLKMHTYKIWEGADGYWRTKVRDTDKLKLIKRKELYSLEDAIVKHYKDHEEVYTFRDIFNSWMERQEICGRSPNTISKYIFDYNRFFKGYPIETMDIKRIDEVILSKHIVQVLSDKPIKWRALKDIYGYIRGIFEKCVRDRLIPRDSNPCLYIDLPIFRKYCSPDVIHTTRERTLTDVERKALLEKLRNPVAHNNNQVAAFAIEMSLYTGMRVGELAALTWGDILYNESVIAIQSSEKYDKIHKLYSIEKTKNCKVRFFPLTSDILDLLNRIESYEKERGWYGEYIFMNDKGRLHTNVISNSIRSRTNTPEFSSPKSIHAVRRTMNSNLKSNGVSTTTAAALLGHTERVNESNYTYDLTLMEIKRGFVEKASRIE